MTVAKRKALFLVEFLFVFIIGMGTIALLAWRLGVIRESGLGLIDIPIWIWAAFLAHRWP